MKKLEKIKLLTSVGVASIVSAAALTLTSCSSDYIAISHVQSSEVTADKDEINIIPGIGFKQTVKLNAVFKDADGNVVEGVKPKWVSNIKTIAYYDNLPEGTITIDEDEGTLTVDPNKITDELHDVKCEIVVWAQTSNDKVKQDKMVGKIINLSCTPDVTVPHVAEISNNISQLTVACGSKQKEAKANLGITYYSGEIGQEAFDNTNWSIVDRGELPKEVDLKVEQDQTNIRNGIVTVNAQNYSLVNEKYYTVTVQAQSMKCPTVTAKTKFQIAITGDTNPAAARIEGSSSITVDPKTPTPYKEFTYQCNISNSGGSVIDNAAHTWELNSDDVKALADAGIKVGFDSDTLVIDTSACTLTAAQSFPLEITGKASSTPNTVQDTKTVSIIVNKLDLTPANVNLNNSKEIVAQAKATDDVTVDLLPILVNRSGYVLPSSPADFRLELSSDQPYALRNSNIDYRINNKQLIINTSNINPDLVDLRSDLQINLIAYYNQGSTSITTPQTINLHVNPVNATATRSIITLNGNSSANVSSSTVKEVHTQAKLDVALLNGGDVQLAGLEPIIEYEGTIPETLKDKIEIKFDATNNNEIVVDVKEEATLEEAESINLTIFCNKYKDLDGNEQIISDETKVGQVNFNLYVSEDANFMILKDDSRVDLIDYISPMSLISDDTITSGKYQMRVPLKTGGDITIDSDNVTHVTISTCSTDNTSTFVPNNFLRNCVNLTSVDLKGLSTVHGNVWPYFLAGCTSLKNVDLSPLGGVNNIGDHFMSNTGVTSTKDNPLNLTGLKNVTSIGTNFLASDEGIEYLNFSPMSKLASVDQYFLYNCKNLTGVNMGAIPSTVIGQYNNQFATDDENSKMYIIGIDLIAIGDASGYDTRFPVSQANPYRKLKVKASDNYIVYDGVGYDIKDNLDLDNAFCGDLFFEIPLEEGAHKEIGNALVITELTKSRITSLNISKIKEGKTTIGDNFLKGCSGLKEISFSGLSKITKIGDNFLSGCTKLKKVDLSPMSNLTEIGQNFAYNCQNLTEVNIGNLQASVFKDSKYTLAHDSFYDRAFGVGTLITGTSDEERQKFVAKFNNQEKNAPYRFLIIDEKYNFVQTKDGIRHELIKQVNPNIFATNDWGSTASHAIWLPLSDFSVEPITMGDIRNLSLRDPKQDITKLDDDFLLHAEYLNNFYITEIPTVNRIGSSYLAYCYNLRWADLEAFPNINEIWANRFMHKNYVVKSFDFSTVKNQGRDLKFNSNDNAMMVDCYNLMEINFGQIQSKNMSVQHWQSFGIRNQLTSPAYLLGRAFVGTYAIDLISRFNPMLGLEFVHDEDSFDIQASDGCTTYNMWIRIWVRNSRLYDPTIDPIIEDLIDLLPI